MNRSKRRAAERRASKAEKSDQRANSTQSIGRPETMSEAIGPSDARLEANRANAEHSTGPRTQAGKAKSSQNSFKHGIYSKQLILHWEDPNEFEQLKDGLMEEHQPRTLTENLLVQEMAEHYWRIQRFRSLETDMTNQDELCLPHITAVHRFMNSAERGFYKALKTLKDLQKTAAPDNCQLGTASAAAPAAVGFVPHTDNCPPETDNVAAMAPDGFVPQADNCQPKTDNSTALASTGFVPQLSSATPCQSHERSDWTS
jgi:hypothetical protein